MPRDELPVLGAESADAWTQWLDGHHADSAGVWLKIAKKGSGQSTPAYPEAVDAALCFGWIDGQKLPLDGDFWLQRFTPRRPGSKWSKINTEKAARLIEEGLMRPAGLREVEAAKADGRWDSAYSSQGTITVPDDLAAALAADETASAFFTTISSANRYAILYRIGDAKRPETRAKRIAAYVAMLADHKTLHP